jgi:hypothetical protein
MNLSINTLIPFYKDYERSGHKRVSKTESMKFECFSTKILMIFFSQINERNISKQGSTNYTLHSD